MIDPAAPAPVGNMGQPIPRYDARAKVTGKALYAADMALPDVAYAYCSQAASRKDESNPSISKPHALCPACLTFLPMKRSAATSAKSNTSPRAVPLRIPWFPLAQPRSPTRVKRSQWCSPKRWKSPRTRPTKLASNTRSSRQQEHSIRKGRLNRSSLRQNKKHDDPKVGDFAAAYEVAPVKLDASYSTPTQHHNPIELFATQCVWNGAQLTVHEPSQNVYGIKNGLAAQLGVEPSQIRVISRYVGGAFGSKGALTQRTAIIAIAARRLGRPVKLVPTREQGFTIATFRAETRHRIQLGATPDGKLQALNHEGFEVTSRADPYAVAGTDASTRMYACPNVASNVTIVRADRATPGFMRAPAETPYFFALESAMDELAVALGHGSDRTAPCQRYADRADQRSALYQPCAHDLLRSSGRGVRLESAQSNAGVEARRRLAGRLGMRRLRLSDPDGGGDGPCPRLFRRPRAGRDSRP